MHCRTALSLTAATNAGDIVVISRGSALIYCLKIITDYRCLPSHYLLAISILTISVRSPFEVNVI